MSEWPAGADMHFEWDEDKTADRVGKHGVTFDEAATVFDDPLSLTGYDPDHSDDEDRFITMGLWPTAGYPSFPTPTVATACGSLAPAWRAGPNARTTKMAISPDAGDDLRPEYDFRTMRGVVRGKYAGRSKAVLRSVQLDPDIAAAFPTTESVNAALREYLRTHPPEPASADAGA